MNNLAKVTTDYAPDIYRSLNGILLVHKPSRFSTRELLNELRARITDALNEYQPRPIEKRLSIVGNVDEEKSIVEVPNFADHPLVVGPRTSGVSIILLGNANRYYLQRMKRANFFNIYHITGRFGYITDNFFYDGKIQDKATFKHIRSGKMDSVLAKIESTQHERLFDSAKVPLDSQEAYELAKSWPSRPPRMATWPVIYRIRCIHLKLPHFKVEVTVGNETETFLAQLSHDIGLMLKSAAHTESIRRVKVGPFIIDNSLTEKDWDLQSIIDNLSMHAKKRYEINNIIRGSYSAMSVRTEYRPSANQIHENSVMKQIQR